MIPDLSSYTSPFSWRYGSAEMRGIFSEENKYRLWRRIWVALARAQNKAGLVSNQELADLEKHEDQIDSARILEIEEETRHDVVAAIREFAEKAKIGGGKIHLGATSMDVVDNADMMRTREAIHIIRRRIDELLALFAERIETYASVVCMGYTHLQPAEPTTVGYRLAYYAQDLLLDRSSLESIQSLFIKGKGLKGAVGTRASFDSALHGSGMNSAQLEEMVTDALGIDAFDITTQVYPRKADYWIVTFVSSVAGSLAKFAEDLRILQAPSIGEWSEPFGKKQVGSSAMPFKKNPVTSEKICSLARFIAALPHVAWENATLSHLERTLDDSANKRLIMAEAFIALDELLLNAQKILEGLVINQERIAFNLSQYGPFAATEVIIIESVKRGANRQEMHELLRNISMIAWNEVQTGKPNPMEKLLVIDKKLGKYLKPSEIKKLMDVSRHVGDAPERALSLAKRIRQTIKR